MSRLCVDGHRTTQREEWRMRISPREFVNSMRAAVILSACLALAAMTSGLLLTIHIGIHKHPADHDSHDCLVCQQLLAVSKEILSSPAGGLICDIQPCRTERSQPAEYVHSRRPQASRQRGPPCAS
jgi:hypothetical protein